MNQDRKTIELLAPARNVECARAAIDHGADAVYIGAPQFGARKVAANTLEDIGDVVRYAHLFGARVHVTLNTLLRDEEVERAREMAWALYRLGVDVLIVQDAALMGEGMPPIEMHASTQCDNRTVEKVKFWEEVGLRQVVLARELSIKEIEAIARETEVRLEYFVHGALCVSYSGQCYMSLADGGRSANRGECAQPCRRAYDVIGADGQVLRKGIHALSLKDNNQTTNIEALMDAGVSSFKIEGRLKDAAYVANITLHYRKVIDEILARRKEYRRLGRGTVVAGFEPDPAKSFNRGFTTYFAGGRQRDIWQPATPKSVGEPIGKVAKIQGTTVLEVASRREIGNGDGLCYISGRGGFGGLKVNTAQTVRMKGEERLQRVVVQSVGQLREGDMVYRNSCVAFDNIIKRDRTERVIGVSVTLDYLEGEFVLTIGDEDGVSTVLRRVISSDLAKNREASAASLERTLGKLGQTHYRATEIHVTEAASVRFASAAEINALRRDACAAHDAQRIAHYHPTDDLRVLNSVPFVTTTLLRANNVINQAAADFYAAHGAQVLEWGYERTADFKGLRLMTTRHCIMNELGFCLREHPEMGRVVPFTLRNEEGRGFLVKVNCRCCEMEVYNEK